MRMMRFGWLIVVVLNLLGCGPSPVYTQESYVFGTRVQVSVYGETPAKARAAVAAVLQQFDLLHHRLHAWQPSELSALNAHIAVSASAVTVAPDLAQILGDATAYSVQSGGLFNPAIGNLIRLWGFQSDTFVPRQPDGKLIQHWVARQPQMTDIVVKGQQVSCANSAVRVDLGGYAKGYALDVAAKILYGMGIHNALVNIGGNIIALGQHGDRPWRVGIQDPRKPQAIASLDLRDGEAIGTSGDYQRYFELNGRRYCHIIDPRTGWPVQGVEAVTVLIPPGPYAGVRSDVDSKPLFISGVAGWRHAALQMGVQAALLIDDHGHVWLTPAMQSRVKFLPVQG